MSDQRTHTWQELADVSRRFSETLRGEQLPDAWEFYTTRKEMYPDIKALQRIPPRTGSTAFIPPPPAAPSVDDCTEWADVAIGFFQIAIEDLLHGDTEGANIAANMGYIAMAEAGMCIADHELRKTLPPPE